MKVYSKHVTTVDSLPNSEDTMREVSTEVLLLEWRIGEQIKNFQGKSCRRIFMTPLPDFSNTAFILKCAKQ